MLGSGRCQVSPVTAGIWVSHHCLALRQKHNNPGVHRVPLSVSPSLSFILSLSLPVFLSSFLSFFPSFLPSFLFPSLFLCLAFFFFLSLSLFFFLISTFFFTFMIKVLNQLLLLNFQSSCYGDVPTIVARFVIKSIPETT